MMRLKDWAKEEGRVNPEEEKRLDWLCTKTIGSIISLTRQLPRCCWMTWMSNTTKIAYASTKLESSFRYH